MQLENLSLVQLLRKHAKMDKIKRTRRNRQHIVGGGTRRLFNKKPRRDVNYPRKMDDWDLFALHPKTDLIITKSSFARLARDIMNDFKPGENYEIDQLALDSLQKCAEARIVQEFEMATIFTARASRATIQSKDMKDAKFIRDLRDRYAVRLETKKMNKMGVIKESD
ncbi:putative histone protein [Botrytis fragariae]|uniref:Putative histone protein n=1 Tax=Botrytis fragariae TaxID=1964551 RepID=A0A8H6EM35_9HELO|nr:putative histone protein [Botrytis fragariae]KAF5877154.1 putative histone protein [Botrytis fragariae]